MINFKTRKEPKMKFFDFGAFQKFKKMVSREKTSFTSFLGHLMIPSVFMGTSLYLDTFYNKNSFNELMRNLGQNAVLLRLFRLRF